MIFCNRGDGLAEGHGFASRPGHTKDLKNGTYCLLARCSTMYIEWRRGLNFSLIKFLRNVIITKTPKTIFDKLTFFSDVHQHSTRQSEEGHFQHPFCRANQIQSTVHYRAMMAWNSLPQFFISDIQNTSFNKILGVFLFTQG